MLCIAFIEIETQMLFKREFDEPGSLGVHLQATFGSPPMDEHAEVSTL